MYKIEDIINQSQLISIIIPTKNEEKYIGKALMSLENSDYPNNKIEIIIVDGGSDDETINIINLYKQKFNNINLFIVPGANTSQSRNIGIRNSHGNFIMNFSGHTLVQKDLLKLLLNKLSNADEDVAGVGCRDTLPPDQNSLVAKASYYIENTIIGGSLMDQHKHRDVEQYAKSISFTLYKRKIFEQIGLFNEKVPYGDDAEFNSRIIKAGYKLLFIPDSVVFRYRRTTLEKYIKQMYNYGSSRMKIIKMNKTRLDLKYFIPSLYILYLLIFPVILISQNLSIKIIYVGGYIIYLLIISLYSFKNFINEKNFQLFLLIIVLYIIQHISYSLGLISEIFKK